MPWLTYFYRRFVKNVNDIPVIQCLVNSSIEEPLQSDNTLLQRLTKTCYPYGGIRQISHHIIPYHIIHRVTLQDHTRQKISEGTSPRPPLAELNGGARSFAGHTEDCWVGQACHRRAAAGGQVALGRAGAPRCILKLGYSSFKSPNDMTSMTTKAYLVPGIS